jgi:cysteine desulfuration protein SufE
LGVVTGLPPLSETLDEYQFLDGEDRYRLLIDLGRKLEPMPDALKTDATKVRGCSASVWVYPTTTSDGRLHFLADSNAAITKGIVALVLSTVQDKPAQEVAAADIAAELAPFDLSRQLSANRIQGVPNMIQLIRETAQRLAA